MFCFGGIAAMWATYQAKQSVENMCTAVETTLENIKDERAHKKRQDVIEENYKNKKKEREQQQKEWKLKCGQK